MSFDAFARLTRRKSTVPSRRELERNHRHKRQRRLMIEHLESRRMRPRRGGGAACGAAYTTALRRGLPIGRSRFFL